jgi:hypothetical protein
MTSFGPYVGRAPRPVTTSALRRLRGDALTYFLRANSASAGVITTT